MVTQSHAHPIPLLLTRPEPQSAEFAQEMSARFGNQLALIKTPLLAPEFYAPPLPDGPFSALIITSKTGVAAYLKLGMSAQILPKVVYCVGDSTAMEAFRAGLQPVCTATDSRALIRDILAQRPSGRLLHLRGRDARGDIAESLSNNGTDTKMVIVYAQERQSLTGQAEQVLRAGDPVLVPLFSARTASIFASEMVRVGGISPLYLAAISDDVALEAGAIPAQVKVALRPDAGAMHDAVALLMAELLHA